MAVTVTVACKLPHGMVLRLFDMVDADEATAGGGYKTVKRAQPRPGVVVLNGYLTKHRNAPVRPPAEASSYALTHGVDKEFFDEWLKQNKDHAAVVNKLIFASEKPESVSGQSRELNKTRSGLEPIDPNRLPKGVATYNKQDTAA